MKALAWCKAQLPRISWSQGKISSCKEQRARLPMVMGIWWYLGKDTSFAISKRDCKNQEPSTVTPAFSQCFHIALLKELIHYEHVPLTSSSPLLNDLGYDAMVTCWKRNWHSCVRERSSASPPHSPKSTVAQVGGAKPAHTKPINVKYHRAFPVHSHSCLFPLLPSLCLICKREI